MNFSRADLLASDFIRLRLEDATRHKNRPVVLALEQHAVAVAIRDVGANAIGVNHVERKRGRSIVEVGLGRQVGIHVLNRDRPRVVGAENIFHGIGKGERRVTTSIFWQGKRDS